MEEIFKTLLSKLPQTIAPSEILDAGCGTGRNLEVLQNLFSPKKLIGLDYSKDALEYAALRKTGSLMEGSTLELPFPDNSFDLVTSMDVIVQLPLRDDPQKAIFELCRVTKPGGSVVLRVAAYNWLRSKHDIALNSHYRFTRKEILQFAKEANLEVIWSSYINTFLFPLALVSRLIGKLSNSKVESDVKPPSKSFMPLNSLFIQFLKLESYLIRNGFCFPFGLSVICILRKKSESQ